MSLSKGSAKFLALIFFLSTITLCFSGPVSRYGGHVSQRSSLLPRKPTQAIDDFLAKLHASQTVSQGEEAFMDFTTTGSKSFGSDGFQGCIGAVIVSQGGAIIGHYSVTATDMSKATTNIPALYNANKDKLAGAQAFVYAEVKYNDQTTFVQPQIKDQLVSLITSTTGLTPTIQTYIEPLEVFVDEEGMPLDNVDYDNVQYGGFVIENAGGGSSSSTLTFVTIDMQVSGVAPSGG